MDYLTWSWALPSVGHCICAVLLWLRPSSGFVGTNLFSKQPLLSILGHVKD
ncbi:uncharacterized protein LACBIDRAFT_298441 [Laccaria bicolor S238N-H82]|uniref:Predicted protein n=1 Tax=Laccaria bicolor (strain S238N-H82 / ATCC MYA-4686) TaxID=486041 RepID=B0DCV2_LACBS|nr:uncharacterized protein LACBIDRAFT_298441 [Laccaria bicolor S238N-H82]EDR07361.1 predicted protein [Laccaria bicolor S238N-H82]|eukprot:XP_001881753.1 predicted protein [Laccaria bicolor S238N-H82]